jgi:hypothetical protein
MQTRKNDAAFPLWEQDEDGIVVQGSGLTKREYFAGLALQGLLYADRFLLDCVAAKAVDLADKLIKELNRPDE